MVDSMDEVSVLMVNLLKLMHLKKNTIKLAQLHVQNMIVFCKRFSLQHLHKLNKNKSKTP